MNSFSKKQLFMSLACPFLCFLWGSVRIISALTGGVRLEEIFVSKYFPAGICFAALLIGGILSAVLTVTLKIHTEEYLIKRLAVIGAVIIVQQVLLFVGMDGRVFALVSLVEAAAVIYQVLKVQNEGTTGGERAVMMMSDPVLYWMIFWFLNFFDILLIT